MKKYDFLQLAVLFVGIWSAYQACLFFCYLIINLLTALSSTDEQSGLLGFFLSDFVIMIGHILIAIVVFTRTERILSRIRITERNTGIEIPAARQLLYIIIIGVGLFLLAQSFPELLDAIFALARSSTGSGSEYPQSSQVALPLMKTIFPLILLVFGRRIVNLFVKK
ncbi:MAG TPA: hypothetical protein VM012_05575 [Flavitalea sp.]|nr:hypothetical protein [Flavitalea sp.]